MCCSTSIFYCILGDYFYCYGASSSNPEKIDRKQFCDGVEQCNNGADESNCNTTTGTEGICWNHCVCTIMVLFTNKPKFKTVAEGSGSASCWSKNKTNTFLLQKYHVAHINNYTC